MGVKSPNHLLHFETKDEWRSWLQENHAIQTEAWLIILKNHATGTGVFYEQAVEEAVCFGWIDGVMKSSTAEFYFLRFSPRKRGSLWSVSNQRRVERLISQGRMTEAGLVKVREAQENGEWQAAILREDPSSLPEDLKEALERNTEAQANFEKFPTSKKKQLLYWIASAKTEKTRQKRIQRVVEIGTQNKR